MTEDLIDFNDEVILMPSPAAAAAGSTDTHGTSSREASSSQRPSAPERSPVVIPPRPLFHQWIKDRQGRAILGVDSKVKPTTVNFIVSHEPEFVEGVIEAIATEFSLHKDKNQEISVEIRGPREKPKLSYLSITSPPNYLAAAIQLARTLADELISDRTVPTTMMVMEPPNFPKGSVEFFVDRITEKMGSRPRVLPCADSFSNPNDGITQKRAFMDQFCLQLTTALKRVGRINSGYNIQVNFGQFYLDTFGSSTMQAHPATLSNNARRVTFNELSGWLNKPRTKGRVKSPRGGLGQALSILTKLRRPDSKFFEDAFADEDGVLRPSHYFEATSTSGSRIEVSLESEQDPVPSKQQKFCVQQPRVFKAPEHETGAGELEFNTFSPGHQFDWKIETVEDIPVAGKTRSLEDYIRSARVFIPAKDKYSDTHYPLVNLNPSHMLVNQFNDFSVKTVFAFRRAQSPYLLELVIRRQWDRVTDMAVPRGQTEPAVPPDVSFNIILRGDYWDAHTRPKQKGRSGWGDELENIFRDNENVTGLARIRAFVEMIHTIREDLEE